jgi:hypothetical protein
MKHLWVAKTHPTQRTPLGIYGFPASALGSNDLRGNIAHLMHAPDAPCVGEVSTFRRGVALAGLHRILG